jgi:protein-tyrosine phosphatase
LTNYKLTWVTPELSVGHAPLSYADLDAIREEGVAAIVNLCGEYCDLHEIEKDSGFEVYYLPIQDECAPDIKEMENAIDWVDQRILQGKKVLVHCRFGVGRTGTFVTAYLLQKGLDMKAASKLLKKTRANPTNSCQWKLLRSYQKKIKDAQ